MKKFSLLCITVLWTLSLAGQNPFAEYGYTPKIATLSKGQYNEFHDQDTVVQIGSVLYNTRSRQIVAFVETDTVYSEATLQPDIVSRWISPDPLADHPTQVMYTPYHYAGDNPIRWTDPDGRCPWCVVWAVVEVGLAVYDAYETGATIIDPSASTGEKLASAGGFVLGAILPGGGYGTGAKQTVKAVDKAVDASKVVDKTTDATKAVAKTEKSGDKARFIVEKDGTVVDTKTTPKGSYEQPNGSRTDVLQDKTHHNKSTGENVGQSHTHEPFSNTNPATGKTYTGADANKAHKPTYEEVLNIISGTAKPVKKQ